MRLRRRSHSGVEVPVRPQIHRPVTEGYCAVITRGGELPEVNCQSVTLIGIATNKVNSIRPDGGTSLRALSEVRSAAQASSTGRGFALRRSRPAEPGARAERKSEATKSRGLTGGWLETEWQEA